MGEIRLCPVDPVEWLDRLREVNQRSQFKPEHVKMIDQAFVRLLKELELASTPKSLG